MTVYIHDAVRTPRGKARADGALAAIKPQNMVAGLVDALDGRLCDVRRRTERLVLGCVGQVGTHGLSRGECFAPDYPTTSPP